MDSQKLKTSFKNFSNEFEELSILLKQEQKISGMFYLNEQTGMYDVEDIESYAIEDDKLKKYDRNKTFKITFNHLKQLRSNIEKHFNKIEI